MIAVPDVRGMSIRRAMNWLISEEFEVKLQGSGVVTQQFPTAGKRTRLGSNITLVCTPRGLVQASLY